MNFLQNSLVKNVLSKSIFSEIILPREALCLIRCNSSDCKKKKKKKNPVKNKVALVTGGTTGIGYSIAKCLLAAGAKGVFIGDPNEELGKKVICKLSKKFGENKVIFMKTDVTKESDFRRAFKCTQEYFKGLDIIVNNAGLLQEDCWSQMIDVNIKGVIIGTKLAFELLGAQNGGKGGVVINNASITALQNFHGGPVYGATKHFVMGLSRNYGCEFYYKPTCVKILTLCPGVTATHMVKDSKHHGDPSFMPESGKLMANELGSLPIQPPDACGCHVVKMLEDGTNGSIWISEGCETYRVCLPDRLDLRAGGRKKSKGCPKKVLDQIKKGKKKKKKKKKKKSSKKSDCDPKKSKKSKKSKKPKKSSSKSSCGPKKPKK